MNHSTDYPTTFINRGIENEHIRPKGHPEPIDANNPDPKNYAASTDGYQLKPRQCSCNQLFTPANLQQEKCETCMGTVSLSSTEIHCAHCGKKFLRRSNVQRNCDPCLTKFTQWKRKKNYNKDGTPFKALADPKKKRPETKRAGANNLSQKTIHCANCNVRFIRASNVQKYCPDCLMIPPEIRTMRYNKDGTETDFHTHTDAPPQAVEVKICPLQKMVPHETITLTRVCACGRYRIEE